MRTHTVSSFTYIPVSEAARISGLSPSRLRALCRGGALQAKRKEGSSQWLIQSKSLLQYCETLKAPLSAPHAESPRVDPIRSFSLSRTLTLAAVVVICTSGTALVASTYEYDSISASRQPFTLQSLWSGITKFFTPSDDTARVAAAAEFAPVLAPVPSSSYAPSRLAQAQIGASPANDTSPQILPPSPALVFTVTPTFVDNALLARSIAELENRMTFRLNALSQASPTSSMSASSIPSDIQQQLNALQNQIALTNKIDQLSGVTLTSPIIVTPSYPGGGGGGGGTWGSITGTLSGQTDLQAALDARLTLSAWYATTTDALDEGSINQYFTNERTDDRLNALLVEGSGIDFTYNDALNTFTIAASGGGGTWGSITGTLSDQTDLQAALDAKATLTSIDTIAEMETLWGAINILTATEIDTSAEILALLTDETGSGALVFADSPTLTGTLAAANATFSGTAGFTGLASFANASTTIFSNTGTAYFGGSATSSFSSAGALTLVNALTYGGVTLSNAVTGTGSMVLSASPTLTGTLAAAAATFSATVGIATTTAQAPLDVYGNFMISGADRYLNFAAVSGTSGYGFRDNAGTIEMKNSGGSWAAISGSRWALAGSDISYVAGNVGIGTTTPSRKLDIVEGNAAPQLRLSKTLAHYADLLVDSVGDLYLTVTGKDIHADDANLSICEGGACPTSTATSTSGNLFVENAVTIGDGFSVRQISSTELGLYSVTGSLMVIFDDGI